jgi:hypothetical protein
LPTLVNRVVQNRPTLAPPARQTSITGKICQGKERAREERKKPGCGGLEEVADALVVLPEEGKASLGAALLRAEAAVLVIGGRRGKAGVLDMEDHGEDQHTMQYRGEEALDMAEQGRVFMVGEAEVSPHQANTGMSMTTTEDMFLQQTKEPTIGMVWQGIKRNKPKRMRMKKWRMLLRKEKREQKGPKGVRGVRDARRRGISLLSVQRSYIA